MTRASRWASRSLAYTDGSGHLIPLWKPTSRVDAYVLIGSLATWHAGSNTDTASTYNAQHVTRCCSQMGLS